MAYKFALCVWLMIQAHVEVMRRTEQEFQILPKRWVLERKFGLRNETQHSKVLQLLGFTIFYPTYPSVSFFSEIGMTMVIPAKS